MAAFAKLLEKNRFSCIFGKMLIIYTNQRSQGPKSNNLFVNLLVLSEAGFLAFQDYVKSKNSFIAQPLLLENFVSILINPVFP